MKNLRNMLALAGCITVLGLSTGSVAAQGRGNFDPAQIQQQMMERIREQMDVKDDAEWKVLEGAITKVTEAQREVGFGGGGLGRLFGGGNRNRGNGGGDNANNNNNNGGDQGGQRRNRGGGPGGLFGAPNPDAEALQTAIDNKAPADEIKSKLAKLRESTKAKEAKLEKARTDLKALLSSRQEATAVLLGLLK